MHLDYCFGYLLGVGYSKICKTPIRHLRIGLCSIYICIKFKHLYHLFWIIDTNFPHRNAQDWRSGLRLSCFSIKGNKLTYFVRYCIIELVCGSSL